MLTIRQEQLQALAAASSADFKKRLTTHLKTILPGANDSEISDLRHRVMQDCADYSITRECDIARYSDIVATRPLDGKLPKPAQNLLLAHGVPAEQRLANLEQHLVLTGGTRTVASSGFPTSRVGETTVSCPQAPQTTKPVHWIEIELMGEDDEPIEGEEYRVILPDQQIVRGYLDSRGWARVQNIEQSGTCRIIFPRLDQEAWSFINSLAAKAAEETSAQVPQ